MATTTPTAPTPTPTATATVPATPAMARTPRKRAAKARSHTGVMDFQLQRLNPPLRLRQVARDPLWDRFKTIMVIIGGLLFFWVFGSEMYKWGTGNSPSFIPTQVWQPAVSIPPALAPAPAAPPQVTVNIPDRIQVDATVRNDDTVSPSAPAPSRELTPEERAEKLKQELRREYGAQ